MGDIRCEYVIYFIKLEGKRTLGRPWHQWTKSIKMDLKELACECAEWIQLAQDRVQWQASLNVVMNLWVS
jgi:hypothetical protein